MCNVWKLWCCYDSWISSAPRWKTFLVVVCIFVCVFFVVAWNEKKNVKWKYNKILFWTKYIRCNMKDTRQKPRGIYCMTLSFSTFIFYKYHCVWIFTVYNFSRMRKFVLYFTCVWIIRRFIAKVNNQKVLRFQDFFSSIH